MPYALTSKKVETRKAWECFGCCREFAKGTQCTVETYMDDGPYRIRLCDDCDRNRNIDPLDWELDGFRRGDLLEYLDAERT